MRVVVAVDGSPGSDRGLDLVAGLGLGLDARFLVVAVAEDRGAGSGVAIQPYPVGLPYAAAPRTSELMASLEKAGSILELAGFGDVDSVLLKGRPARAICQLAAEFRADLIVVGHRGRGALASTLLGSTSLGVIEEATCPVLVARGTEVHSILIATDDSEASREALRVAAEWPIFAQCPITVLCVADVRMPVAVEVQAGLYEQILKSYAESLDEARLESKNRAQVAADGLVGAGRAASPEVREGGAAGTIVEAAGDLRTDLIVMGTSGHRRLVRMAIGSTARSVTIDAPCSVLVVPRPVADRAVAGERATAEV